MTCVSMFVDRKLKCEGRKWKVAKAGAQGKFSGI